MTNICSKSVEKANRKIFEEKLLQWNLTTWQTSKKILNILSRRLTWRIRWNWTWTGTRFCSPTISCNTQRSFSTYNTFSVQSTKITLKWFENSTKRFGLYYSMWNIFKINTNDYLAFICGTINGQRVQKTIFGNESVETRYKKRKTYSQKYLKPVIVINRNDCDRN